MSLSFVHLFHIIFVGGLFLYVGINREKFLNCYFAYYLGWDFSSYFITPIKFITI